MPELDFSPSEMTDVCVGWARLLAVMRFPGLDAESADKRARHRAYLATYYRDIWNPEHARNALEEIEGDHGVGLLEKLKAHCAKVAVVRFKLEEEYGMPFTDCYDDSSFLYRCSKESHAGCISGRILKNYLRCDVYHRDEQLNSLERVAAGLNVQFRALNSTRAAASKSYIVKARYNYESVMHFWAAWNDFVDGIVDSENTGPTDFPLWTFLIRSQLYYEMAQNLKLARRGSEPRPIIDPEAAWVLSKGIVEAMPSCPDYQVFGKDWSRVIRPLGEREKAYYLQGQKENKAQYQRKLKMQKKKSPRIDENLVCPFG